MTKLGNAREQFLEIACPDSAPASQITDMSTSFDAGVLIMFKLILQISALPEEQANAEMNKLAREIENTSTFHMAQ